MTEHSLQATARAASHASANPTVTRGEKSWTFLYLVAVTAVSVEGTVVQMIEPWHWLVREALFVALAALTLWLVLWSGAVQNWLLTWKFAHENKAR